MFKFNNISYKNLNPKRKIKGTKPNPPTPLSPPSPASFESPEIFEIHGPEGLDTLHEADEYAHISDTASRKPPPSPRVQLEYSPEPLSDWFPKNLFESDSFSFFGKHSESRASGLGWGLGNLMSGSKAINGIDVQNTKGRGKTGGASRDGFVFLSEEGTPQYQSEITQPTFVDISSSDVSQVQPETPSRKPAPLKIPESPLHAKVQGPHYPVPSYPPSTLSLPTQTPSGLSPSRPGSPASMEDGMSSAVSGTTLARALFANSFILSSDKRTSRHRSGMVRQDSATLPRGEFPFWRDKRISGGEIILSASSGRTSPVPPVPPVPANAELLYAQQSARRSGASSASGRRKTPDLAELQSAKSFGEAEYPYTGLIKEDDSAPRRISPISEAPSSSTSLLIAPDRFIATARHSSSSSGVSISPSPRSVNPTSFGDSKPESEKVSTFPPHTRSERSDLLPVSATPSVIPSAGSGSGLINDILDGYHSRSGSLSPKGKPLHSPSIRSATSSTSGSSLDGGGRQSAKRRRSGGKVRIVFTTDARGKPDLSHPRHKAEARLLSINPGDNRGRLPIGQQRTRGQRPRSLQVPQTPESPTQGFPQTAIGSATVPYAERSTNITIPSIHSFTLDSLDSPRPVPRGNYTRQRSGSTPNFSFTVDPDSVIGGRRSTIVQTFPETPSAFSPMFTPGAIVGSSWADPNFHFDASKAPEMPMRSAALKGSFDQPSLAQQVLLSRAVTSVAGNRSPPAARPPRHPYARQMSLLLTPPDEEDVDAEAKPNSDNSAGSSNSSQRHSPEPTSEHIDPSSAGNGPRSISPSTSVSSNSNSARPKPLPFPPLITPVESPVEETVAQANNVPAPTIPTETSHNTSVISLPIAEPSQTATPALTPNVSTPPSPQPRTPLPPVPPLPSTPPSPQPRTPLPPVPPLPSPPAPRPGSPRSQNFTTPPRLRLLPRQPQTPSTPPPPPPPPSFSSSNVRDSSRTSYDSDLGAPPPYSTVVSDHRPLNQTRQTGRPLQMVSPSQTITYSGTPTPSERTVMAADLPASQRRARVRPPLPAGPRKPPSQVGVSTASFRDLRERNGSMSSISSSVFHTGGLPSGGSTSSQRLPYSTASPKFITQPLQWRGFPMEAAKWTFTSEELQAIVSRAIKQSAEASAIRLLRLETLDDELPDEMHRLEMLKVDMKTRYKALARRRWNLMGSLSSHIDGTQEDESGDVVANMRTTMEELGGVLATLDRLAEELHNTDEQIAQVKSLRDVHSSSALAMALRKLNSSFLKQVAESQALRVQIESLEAERDEAWKQADEVAHDYDNLTEKVVDASVPMTPVSVKSPSCRSSQVLAVRKSSIRVSKAGLRQSRGHRSSMIINNRRTSSSISIPSAVRSTFVSEDIPPVPRLPLALGIVTSDLPSRNSFVSTGSPSSETRAMVRAQEELYEMLGIPIHTRGRRPQSMRSPTADTDDLPSPSPNRSSDGITRGHRPSSLPGSADLSRYYDVMTADRKAMLATLGMMSD